MLRLSVGVAYGSPLQIFYIFFYIFLFWLFVGYGTDASLIGRAFGPYFILPPPFKLFPTLLLATTPYDSPKVPPSYS